MRRIAPLALVAALLSACSSIPSSGPIVIGDRVDVMSNDVNVRVIARPPSKGMGPEALVRGFIAASASLADGDGTARKYLTPQASANWNPSQLADVYEAAALTVAPDHNDTVKLSAPLLGTIDSHRRYNVADPGKMLVDSLHLAQVNGEWRIDRPPSALYLSEGDVARSYRPHAVYFLNQSRDRLVPEFVVIPVSAPSVPTLLMHALLNGPSSADQPVLGTGVPDSVSLAYGSVTGDFGSVTVSLTRAALSAGLADRIAMLAQITWTLTGLPSISSVRVQVDGEPLQTIGGRSVFTASDFQGFDPAHGTLGKQPLVFVSKDKVMSLLNGTRTTIGAGTPVAESAMSRDGSLIVSISASHTMMLVTSGPTATVATTGGDLGSPRVLSNNEAWYLDHAARGGIYAWTASGGVVRVRTGLASRARILDFAIAPDESRIAVIVNDGADSSLRIGQIMRSGRDIRVIGLTRAEQRLTSVVAVAWASESDLAVLGAVGAVAVQAIRISLPTGAVTLLGGPANAVALTATAAMPIVVGDQTGQLWQLSAGRWNASDLGTAPNYVM